jgi:hypothetical protein
MAQEKYFISSTSETSNGGTCSGHGPQVKARKSGFLHFSPISLARFVVPYGTTKRARRTAEITLIYQGIFEVVHFAVPYGTTKRALENEPNRRVNQEFFK